MANQPNRCFDVIVIGGGIAGLTAAALLKRQNRDVLLLEKHEIPGGNIKTIDENGCRMETGPHSFMGSSEFTWKLVEEMGYRECVEPATPASKNRYIYRHNKLTPLPMSPLSFIKTPLLSFSSKLRLMMEPIIPNGAKPDDTAWDFFCRRFGKEAATFIMTPFVSGVYAGDVKMLGARASFNKFWKFEKDGGSMILGAISYMVKKRRRLRKAGVEIKRGLFSFKNGLGNLTQKLAEYLSDSIETGISVDSIRKHQGNQGAAKDNKDRMYTVIGNGRSWNARSIIVATPPPSTAALFKELTPDLPATLNQIPMSPVTVIHWRVKDSAKDYPDGFGFLMPRVFNLRVLGTLFPSKLFKERVADGWQLFVSFYGGMTDQSAMNLDDNQITELLMEEHRKIFNRELEGAEILRIIRYPGAIPQLLPNHPEAIEGIVSRLSKETPGIFLAGNYLTGVGIEHAVESGFRASHGCSDYLTSL